jgi:hypothetical protein
MYSKDLLISWLYENRQKTLPKDYVELAGWPMDTMATGVIARVCKRSKGMVLKKSPGVTDSILNRLTFCTKLTEFDLSGCTDVTDQGIEILRKNFCKLRSLSLQGLKQITINTVPDLIYSTTALHTLNLGYCDQMTDAVLHALATRTQPNGVPPIALTDLNFAGCTRLTDAGVGELVQNCTGLVSLSLRNCKNVTGMSFSVLQKVRLPSLTSLDLSGVVLHDLDLSWIAQGCSHLTFLTLDRVKDITDIGLTVLVDYLSELRVLNLNGCVNIGDLGIYRVLGYAKGLREIAEAKKKVSKTKSNQEEEDDHLENHWKSAIKQLGLDVHVDAASKPSPEKQSVESLALTLTDAQGGCLKLRELGLRKCSNITAKGLVALAATSDHIPLEAVHLQKRSGGATVHNRGALYLARSKSFARNIRKLSLIDQNGILEKSLCTLVRACKDLEFLDLSGCVHVSDAVLKALRLDAPKGGKKQIESEGVRSVRPLKSINLTRCKLVTDVGAKILASKSCGNISTIVVSSCVQITDGFLVALARGYSGPSLRAINLSAIPNISDVGLVALVRRCKTLSKLVLNNCVRVTDVTVNTLAKISWKCQASALFTGIEPRPLCCTTAMEAFDIDTQAAIKLQRRYRIRLLGKEKFRAKQLKRLQRLQHELNCTVTIQCWWRGVFARIVFKDIAALRERVRAQHRYERAIIRVQTTWRGRATRKRQAPRLWQLKRSRAATKIQSVLRGFLVRQNTKQIKRRMHNRQAINQSLKKMANRLLLSSFCTWRVTVAKKVMVRNLAYRAFCGKQRLRWNMWLTWIKLKKRYVKTMVRRLQRWWRGYLKKQANAAAAQLQNAWRSKAARQQLVAKRARRDAKEKKVKSFLNRIKMRVAYKCLHGFHANMLQARKVKRLAMRCMMSTTRVYFDDWKEKWVDIRERKMISSVVVQKRWRGNQGRKRARMFQKIKAANRLLRNEKLVRSCFRNRFMQREARRRIAHWWRRCLLRWRVPLFLAWWRNAGALFLQRMWRGSIGRGIASQRRRLYTKAALDVQRVYRGHCGRKLAAKARLVIHLHRAAILLQRHWRARLAKRFVSEEKARQIAASQMIERIYRGHIGRFLARKRRLQVQIRRTRHFSERVKSRIGINGNLSNIKAMRENFALDQKVEECQRFVKARSKKQLLLRERFQRAKSDCEQKVTLLMAQQKRSECITEGIFLDNCKRRELGLLATFLKDHCTKLEAGVEHLVRTLLEDVYLKSMIDQNEYDEMFKEYIVDPAAIQVKNMKLDHVALRNSNYAKDVLKRIEFEKALAKKTGVMPARALARQVQK